ncbi:hypothetical protein GGR42_000345 [Saonia flava]|uniref:3-keto-alpha-glucoside-1,2-lyase/3-keto-2-hydroxy-glucal hydratase domain-containing protein n=1 Tax=Saonia flava TaxID=523696 RepID=A0A846QU85_9FLAO|nr:DUF1080 domain-containing protein [Saonia flava]NJB69883.1 hypothetical protein [Saonia flava]
MNYCKPIFVALLILLSSKGYSQEWEVLFDGANINALRGYKMDTFPTDRWEVVDGALSTITDVQNVDIVTKEMYQDFELVFEWKVSKAGNSGVFFHVQEVFDQEAGNGNSPNWLNDFEFQILDDIDFYDKDPMRSAGSLYDLITPTNKTLKQVGEYNTAKLIVKDNHVEHWINGKKVVDYVIGGEALNALLAKSKFKDNPEYGTSKKGHIMFQHHGQKVWYKNIKIRRL